jgi:hypothetical protein
MSRVSTLSYISNNTSIGPRSSRKEEGKLIYVSDRNFGSIGPSFLGPPIGQSVTWVTVLKVLKLLMSTMSLS